MISSTDPLLFGAKMIKSQSTDAFDLYANSFETLFTAKKLFFSGGGAYFLDSKNEPQSKTVFILGWQTSLV